MKRRFLPMFCTYRELKGFDGPEEDQKFFGLSSPFPVQGSVMLEHTIKNAKLSGLDLIFVGFFDPLMEKDTDVFTGGFKSVDRLVPVSSEQSFRDYIVSLCNSRGIDLLYSYESKEEA